MGPTSPEIPRQPESTSTRPHVDRASNKTHGQPNFAQPGYYHGNSYPKPFHGSGYQDNHSSQHDSFIDYGTGYVGKPAPRQNTYWQHDQSHQGKYYVQKSGSYQQYPSTKYVNKGNNHRYNPNKSFTAGMGETGQPNARRDNLSTAEDNRRSSGNNEYRGDGRYGQLQKSGNHQHYPSTKYVNKSNNSRYNPNKSFTAGMGETGQQNARRDNFSTTEDDRRSSGHNGSNNPEYQGYGKQNQILKSENHQHYSSTKYANKSSEYIHNKSFTAGMGETGQPNARRDHFWNANSRHHSSNSKRFENRKNGANVNRNWYRYNSNTSYVRYTGAKRGPENVADHNTTVDLNIGGFESSQHNGDSFIQVFPSSTSSNLTDEQKLLQNLQNMESKVKLVDDSLMNQSFRGVQDQSCPQDSSILAVGPIFTPPRPVKYPYMFSPAVEKLLGSEQHEKKDDKQVASADKDSFYRKLILPPVSKGVKRTPPSPPHISNDVTGWEDLKAVVGEIAVKTYVPLPQLKSPSRDFGSKKAGSSVQSQVTVDKITSTQKMADVQEKKVEITRKLILPPVSKGVKRTPPSPPHISKNVTGWEDLNAVVDEIAVKTHAPLPLLKSPSRDFGSKKAGSSVQSQVTVVKNTSDQKLAVIQEKKVEITRKLILPPVSKGVKRTPPSPPHISNNVTGWEDLKAVVDEIAMKTCAPLPQLKSPSMMFESQKAGSSVQSSATVLENTADQKLAVVQEKKVEITRKLILPPISKGVKRTPPKFIHVADKDWFNDTPTKTIDEQKVDEDLTSEKSASSVQTSMIVHKNISHRKLTKLPEKQIAETLVQQKACQDYSDREINHPVLSIYNSYERSPFAVVSQANSILSGTGNKTTNSANDLRQRFAEVARTLATMNTVQGGSSIDIDTSETHK